MHFHFNPSAPSLYSAITLVAIFWQMDLYVFNLGCILMTTPRRPLSFNRRVGKLMCLCVKARWKKWSRWTPVFTDQSPWSTARGFKCGWGASYFESFGFSKQTECHKNIEWVSLSSYNFSCIQEYECSRCRWKRRDLRDTFRPEHFGRFWSVLGLSILFSYTWA